MTDEYMEALLDNFLFWVKNKSGLDQKRDYLIIECMFVAWVEATKQSDTRSSIK
jgi:hypothetical protein